MGSPTRPGRRRLFRIDYDVLVADEDERASREARSRLRRERIVAHRAWDLEFWQAQGPEARLSALAAIRRDVEAVEAGPRGGRH